MKATVDNLVLASFFNQFYHRRRFRKNNNKRRWLFHNCTVDEKTYFFETHDEFWISEHDIGVTGMISKS